MRILSILILLPSLVFAVCTPFTRTDYLYQQKLTSTQLNADFNAIVNNMNSYDLSCGVASSLTASQLDTTEFAVPLNHIQEGCDVWYAATDSVTIGPCVTSVNNQWIKTTGNTTMQFGCTGCSSQATGSTYYVYAKSGSTGSTMLPLLSTTAPDGTGVDASNNKLLGKFRTIVSGVPSIASESIQIWNKTSFNENTSHLITNTTFQDLKQIRLYASIIYTSGVFIPGNVSGVEPNFGISYANSQTTGLINVFPYINPLSNVGFSNELVCNVTPKNPGVVKATITAATYGAIIVNLSDSTNAATNSSFYISCDGVN